MSKRPRPTHTTRAERNQVDLLKRVGIWIVIFALVFSMAGGLFIFSAVR